jgi:uncharacterized protein
MLIVISPAKTLNYTIQSPTQHYTLPAFRQEAAELVDVLRKYSPEKLQKLMHINSKLAGLNATRFMEWHLPFTTENAQRALLVFNGEVYNGLLASTLPEADLIYAQDHLRILSGLYGALRPLDLMQPYRLEMGTKLKVKRKTDLYKFWGTKITEHLREVMESTGQQYLINLASNEYFKSIDTSKLPASVITPVFKDFSGGTYKFLTVYGKKARGMMARYIIQNRIENAEQLKLFDAEGYFFNEQLSKGNEWVFTRG